MSRDEEIVVENSDIIVRCNIPKEETDYTYIENVLKNANDNIERNKNKEENKVNEANKVKTTKKETDENRWNKTVIRFNALLLVIIIIIPVLQIASIFKVSTLLHIIISIISFFVLFILGKLIGEQTMTIVSGILICISAMTINNGFSHGLIQEDLGKRSLNEVFDNNLNTPKKYEGVIEENEIVSKFKGKFVYYYKYGCKDCKAINADIESLLNEREYEVVNIETRSKIGRIMLEKYPINEVPAGLVIKDENDYKIKVLYQETKEEDNVKSVIDAKNMNELLKEIDDAKG